MTAKRFTLMSVVNFDYGINDNGEPIGSLANICDLLNNLNDENEQLKIQLQEKYQDLTELGLKYGDIIDIKIANEVIENQRKHIKEVEKENEELKQQVQNIHKLIDKKMEQCVLFSDTKSVVILSDLKEELKGDD